MRNIYSTQLNFSDNNAKINKVNYKNNILTDYRKIESHGISFDQFDEICVLFRCKRCLKR